jgi:hypothetical protein
VVGKDKMVAGGKFIGSWVGGKWTIIANKVRGHRSLDGTYLEIRDAEAEPFYPFEDAALVSRSAEAEAEPEFYYKEHLE